MQVHNDQKLLAHSAPNEGMSCDPYARHIKAVRQGALKHAEEMLRYATNPPLGMIEAIKTAATFHDLGKLDPDIQAVFRKGRGKRLKWDHIDAGVAHLSAGQNWMAAWLVRAHHAPGLPRKTKHFTEKTDRRLRGRRRDEIEREKHDEQIARTDNLLSEYLGKHEGTVGHHEIKRYRPIHGLAMRLALSCLVDADHSDSAFFDSGRLPHLSSKPQWKERLDSLCKYVTSLPTGESETEKVRNQQRNDFFQECLQSNINNPIVACEGPVGIGKTTAISAFLIRQALDKGLRRLIIVAPYTNILTQTADRLRKALILPGEHPEQVIAEHHHKADFNHIEDREFSILWKTPIVLTTAVSFFETLAACDPSTLRKLHYVPGSAIFLDEAHAALPTKLWPQNWEWIRELSEHWGCRIVFASGSLVRFWEHADIVKNPLFLQKLMHKEQAKSIIQHERQRITFMQAKEGRVLTIQELIALVTKELGPRLVILNTVQNAALVAKVMRDSGIDVLHLSTALTPFDREAILKRVERRFQFQDFKDWTLVATSCIEAGVDLSFRCAFRERFAAASTIQVGGRVNRHGEYNTYGGGKVYDFALCDKGVTQHPAANISADVLNELMNNNRLNLMNPANLVTLAMKEELKNLGGLPIDLLQKAESERDYPKVKELGKVIDTDTRFVVIDSNLKNLLNEHKPVNYKTLLQGSVQLWATKISKLGLSLLSNHREIYVWNDIYDPDFLGYMSGVLRNEQFMSDNQAWII